MKHQNEKYNRILNLLKESKPSLDTTEGIEREVIAAINKSHKSNYRIGEIFDFLFSWIYIDWIRRSLITASVALVMIFAYQQTIILKRLDSLSKQTIVSDKGNSMLHTEEVEKKLTNFVNSGRRFPLRTITVSEKQMKELIESVEDLQIKYKDLENMIESDPELKKLIEQKLLENNRTKANL